ncbi:MAG: transposase [Candidatus Omnitrophica bacterium]|nr:transposase [Candidatus Omnitrophota bacterium]
MPRLARKHQLQDNVIYHIINRANRKAEIFHDDEDYEQFRKILIKYKNNRGLKIYHYCIMSNHYHLEVELPSPEELSSIMAGINRTYSHYYHAKYNTSGYLWQGRFKSIAMQKDEHILECGRYIENNPVEAKIVKHAEDYAYSSARYYVSGIEDDVVTQDRFYFFFGQNDQEQRKNYGQFLRQECPSQKEKYENGEKVLGNRDFKRKMISKQGRWVPARRGNKSGTNTFVT